MISLKVRGPVADKEAGNGVTAVGPPGIHEENHA
jgi:hypothetical protein